MTQQDEGAGSQPDTGQPRPDTGRPWAGSSPAGTFGMLDGIHDRVDLIALLSRVLILPEEECEFLVRLAIDEGPITPRATTEMTIVALGLIAKNVVTDPKPPEEVYPIYLEHLGHFGPHHHGPPHHGPPHHGPPHNGPLHNGPPHNGPPHQGSYPYPNGGEANAGMLPLGVPVAIPEKALRYSYINNRLAVPGVGGPNHERASLVLITNLVYQIWQATGDLP